jgi:hypothetical protein
MHRHNKITAPVVLELAIPLPCSAPPVKERAQADLVEAGQSAFNFAKSLITRTSGSASSIEKRKACRIIVLKHQIRCRPKPIFDMQFRCGRIPSIRTRTPDLKAPQHHSRRPGMTR